jgi:S-adenosylmethionine:tRNA ribosyltransferase-isomerase
VKTADFDYALPPELIAQEPLAQRDQSRMMVLERAARTIRHSRFADLAQWLRPGDLLVLNDTKVIPSRLFAVRSRRDEHGRLWRSKVEVLLLEERAPGVWEALVRPGQKVHVKDQLTFGAGEFTAVVEEWTDFGGRVLRFESAAAVSALLDKYGAPPLPPYITRARQTTVTRAHDVQSYQTVFARVPGAAAAPTAGLHFTEQMFERLRQAGLGVAYVTLHVGLGTFRPVRTETVEEHAMHRERFTIPADSLRAIAETKARGGRVVAVGTTVVRTLEAAWSDGAMERWSVGISGATDIFIYPPFEFRVVDALLTNFHLPRSTLLMLVSAFAAPGKVEGREFVLGAYAEAVKEKYRFYSYGDCMLLR